MHVGNGVACITLAVGKDNLSLGVVDEQPYQFAAGVSSGTEYSDV